MQHLGLVGTEWKVQKIEKGLWALSRPGEKTIRLPLAAIETLVAEDSDALTYDFLKALWKHGVPVEAIINYTSRQQAIILQATV